ncbi:MAG: hypothetical protein NKF70_10345 [Methanobacterium sp. ERen5]|nr:MAG: hypothetical protein NKF70_10345 [Methanobacterium sp. ERen5]
MMKNIFWRILIVGLIVVSGTGLASASNPAQLGIDNFRYQSQFENLQYNTSGNNTISLNGTLTFTDNSTIKPIARAYLFLAIIGFTDDNPRHNIVYHGICVTDKDGKFQFNSGPFFTGFPGNYTLFLCYHGNKTYQPINTTFDI